MREEESGSLDHLKSPIVKTGHSTLRARGTAAANTSIVEEDDEHGWSRSIILCGLARPRLGLLLRERRPKIPGRHERCALRATALLEVAPPASLTAG
eukprot:3305230-Prymnesium_polylepis.1